LTRAILQFKYFAHSAKDDNNNLGYL
jgi:hypothetical protein